MFFENSSHGLSVGNASELCLYIGHVGYKLLGLLVIFFKAAKTAVYITDLFLSFVYKQHEQEC